MKTPMTTTSPNQQEIGASSIPTTNVTEPPILTPDESPLPTHFDPIYAPPCDVPDNDPPMMTPPATPPPPTRILTAQQITPYGHVYTSFPNTFLPPMKKFLRVYVQNVNSLKVTSSCHTEGLTQFYEAASTIQTDIFMANETFLDTTKSPVWEIMKRVSAQYWRSFCNHPYLIYSTSSIRPSCTFSKPGENLSGLVDNITGRFLTRISDPYGRWCGLVLHGKDQRQTLFLIAYQVPYNSSPGNTILQAQQHSLYRMNNVRNPNPRKLFIKPLKNLLQIIASTMLTYLLLVILMKQLSTLR